MRHTENEGGVNEDPVTHKLEGSCSACSGTCTSAKNPRLSCEQAGGDVHSGVSGARQVL